MAAHFARLCQLWTFFALLWPALSQVYVPACAAKCANNIMRTSSCDSDPTCLCLSLVHQMLPDCACYACSASDIAAVNDATHVMCPNNFETNVTCDFLPSTTQTTTATGSATAGFVTTGTVTTGSTPTGSTTSSASPNSVSSSGSSSTGLSTGAKAGVAAGVGGGVLLIALIAFFAYRKGRASSQTRVASSDLKLASPRESAHSPEVGGAPPDYAANELRHDEKKFHAAAPTVTELAGHRETATKYTELNTFSNSHEAQTMYGNSHELGGGTNQYLNARTPARGMAELPDRRFD